MTTGWRIPGTERNHGRASGGWPGPWVPAILPVFITKTQEGEMEEQATGAPFIAYYDSLMKDRQARSRIGLPSARAVMLSLIVLAERDMWTPNGVRHGYDDEIVAVFAGLAPSTTRNYLNKLAAWGYVHKQSNGTFLPKDNIGTRID